MMPNTVIYAAAIMVVICVVVYKINYDQETQRLRKKWHAPNADPLLIRIQDQWDSFSASDQELVGRILEEQSRRDARRQPSDDAQTQ